MRKIVLDTETTGLNPQKDKIIEIGCVELINNVPSGITFHKYFTPGNVIISDESQNIHGLSNDFLKQFDSFENKVGELMDFLADSPIIIHNVSFDLSMVNAVLERMFLQKIERERCLCTLELSRKKFPGSKVNLNALCRRYGISLQSREKHGALTDSFLLAEVYLELMGGKQRNLFLKKKKEVSKMEVFNKTVDKYKKTPLIAIDSDEMSNHQDLIKRIKNSIWNLG